MHPLSPVENLGQSLRSLRMQSLKSTADEAVKHMRMNDVPKSCSEMQQRNKPPSCWCLLLPVGRFVWQWNGRSLQIDLTNAKPSFLVTGRPIAPSSAENDLSGGFNPQQVQAAQACSLRGKASTRSSHSAHVYMIMKWKSINVEGVKHWCTSPHNGLMRCRPFPLAE